VNSVVSSRTAVHGTDGTTAAPAASTVRAQSQQIQQQVVNDVNKALQQGADRNQAAEK
jgi:hypothetical protein